MAEVFEISSQELSDKRAVRKYTVLDVADAITARGMVNALAPILWDGKVKQDVQVSELGSDHWEGEVPYAQQERGETGDINWSFNIATQSVQITHGLAHVHTYPGGGDPHKGAIGVTIDGNGQSVKGCNAQVMYFTWDETHYYPVSVVATYAFVSNLEALVSTCNQAAWRIWGAQELLLLGAESTGSTSLGPEVAVGVKYRFASSRTKSALSFGDITGVTRIGHNYLWIEYEEKEEGEIGTSRPVRVHTERIYELADWATNLPLPGFLS